MTKVRFSISVDEDYAARIKAAAALSQEDVSSYMSKAALAQVEQDERAAAVFADIDRQIAESEAPVPISWPPPAVDGYLTAEERAQIQAKWDALLGITRAHVA